MRSLLRFLAALVVTNWKACLALRGAFLVQAGAMALNNLLFFATWWIFFSRFEEVRGWQVGDMLALFGIVASGFGTATSNPEEASAAPCYHPPALAARHTAAHWSQHCEGTPRNPRWPRPVP